MHVADLNVYIKQSDSQVHLDPLQIFQKFKPQTVNRTTAEAAKMNKV